MSFQRSILVAIATLITMGMTQVASAQTGCGGCGGVAYAPVIYATPIAPQPIAVGCGNCGAPVTCCAPSVAASYAAPVAQWGGGCGGCGAPVGYGGYGGYGGGYGGGYSGCGNCGGPAVYTTPAPLYVVNQGPAFEGPGLMVPYHSYAPPVEYAPPPVSPPYAGGYGGGYGGGYAHRYYPHVAYGGGQGYYHPHMMAPHYGYGARPYMMHRPYWRG
jgi:hypothetical protein